MDNYSMKEIGSEYWLKDITSSKTSDRPHFLSSFNNIVFTTTGRGALSLMLDTVEKKVLSKNVLLPAYICESVIQPFYDRGYNCLFYDINDNLNLSIDIKDYESKKIGIFLHLGYFGFPTNANIKNQIQILKSNGTFIVEDITHSMFSKYERYPENDFYFGSIRKWFGTPGGGFLASCHHDLLEPMLKNDRFTQLRKEALLIKRQYMGSKIDEMKLKNRFLEKFAKAERILDEDTNIYQLDDLSYDMILQFNYEDLISKRRENYLYLANNLQKLNNLIVVFKELDAGTCPLFLPVIIKENRDEIRAKLANHKIYCPIHWPIHSKLAAKSFKHSYMMYNNGLSIPCDQRYGIADMKKIVSVIKSII